MTTQPQMKLKQWAANPFERVVAYLRETAEFAEAVTFGVANTGKLALAEEVFQEIERRDPALLSDKPSEASARLKELRKRAGRADRQIQDGLPLLHSQMVIGIWSVLEAAIDDFVVAWLIHVPGSLDADDFSKIRVPATIFEQMDKAGRMQFVLDEYKRQLRSDSKSGVERFESLLKPLGLSGKVTDDVRKDIFELSHIRNAILHRASRADQRLLDACPWLALKVGERLIVTSASSDRFARSVTNYLKAVIDRVRHVPDAVT